MSEGKHTPGPWRVEEGTTLIWGACNPDDSSNYGMGYPIAECRVTPSAAWAKGPDGWEEGEASSRLISAAPEMLEALYQCLVSLKALGAGDGYASEAARAAISKAKGINPDE